MVNVTMYSSAGCGYCRSAEHLLKRKGIAQINKILVDEVPGALETMIQKTGRRSVPQIYIGSAHVGGFDDLLALDKAGKLATLLAK